MIAPEEFIERIREIWPDGYAEMSFGCFKFAALLKAIYPAARARYDGGHVITEIAGRSYDIDGEVIDASDFIEIDDFPIFQTAPRGTELLQKPAR